MSRLYILDGGGLSAVRVRRAISLIAVLAVGVRTALAWIHPFLFDDSRDYLALGQAIAQGQPYQVDGNIAMRMPGYPAFIALIGGGNSVHAVLFIQALVALGFIILTGVLASRAGGIAGLVASGLIAIDPVSVGFSAALLSEIAFTFALMMSLWFGVELMEGTGSMSVDAGGWPTVREWFFWARLGAVWAVAVYLRASALWVIVPLVFWIVIWQRKRPLLARFLGALLALVLVFAALVPWLLRNDRHFHSGFFRLTTLEGISLYEAVYPEADGGPRQDKIVPLPQMQGMNEAQVNDEWARLGWQYVRSDPLRVARLALVKVGRTWSPWFNAAEFKAGPIQLVMAMWYIPLFGLAVVGVVASFRGTVKRELRTWGLLLIPVVYFSGVHALFLGSVRYRVPLEPIICIFAAIGLMKMVNWVKRGKRAELGAV